MYTWNDDKSSWITEFKLLEGSQHHTHDILYTYKSNFEYINTKRLNTFWVAEYYFPINHFRVKKVYCIDTSVQK